jgi:hypothetical protein
MEKVAEYGSENRKPDIEVEVIQAHRETLPGGGFVERKVGDIIEIEFDDFCSNLHRQVACAHDCDGINSERVTI